MSQVFDTPEVSTSETSRRYRWSVADYHRLGDAGILDEDTPVELIDGELVEMAPIGSPHGGEVKYLIHLFSSLLQGKVIISAQDPITLGDASEPQPDLALLRWRDDFYRQAHPGPEDVRLLIEVANTTARNDRDLKIPLYARHGIPEVWLLDLPQRRLERYLNPEQGEYTQISYHRSGQISPSAFPNIAIQLTDLFPETR
jgi:Uma2 family endonuclease